MKEKAVLLPKLIYPVSFTHVLKNNSPGKRNFILPPDFFPPKSFIFPSVETKKIETLMYEIR